MARSKGTHARPVEPAERRVVVVVHSLLGEQVGDGARQVHVLELCAEDLASQRLVDACRHVIRRREHRLGVVRQDGPRRHDIAMDRVPVHRERRVRIVGAHRLGHVDHIGSHAARRTRGRRAARRTRFRPHQPLVRMDAHRDAFGRAAPHPPGRIRSQRRRGVVGRRRHRDRVKLLRALAAALALPVRDRGPRATEPHGGDRTGRADRRAEQLPKDANVRIGPIGDRVPIKRTVQLRVVAARPARLERREPADRRRVEHRTLGARDYHETDDGVHAIEEEVVTQAVEAQRPAERERAVDQPRERVVLLDPVDDLPPGAETIACSGRRRARAHCGPDGA
eukprot:5566625-Prymnesium_polylepis.2